jgi:threonine/homoserine/homoserine lactone efflux protein
MDLASYLLFVAAAVVLVAVPGPDMAYMLARTIAQGRAAGITAAVGINAGAYVHVCAAVFGLSAILATSAIAFSAVKWIGACYLIWIGIRALRSKTSSFSLANEPKPVIRRRRIFFEGFLSDVLNPKVAIFFLAFLPQFVHTDSSLSVTLQLLILGVTANVIAVVMNIGIVFLCSAATSTLRRRPQVVTWLNKLSGALFIALGLRLARCGR